MGYSLTNIALRAAVEVDPFWVSTWKSLPGAVVCWLWLWANLRTGRAGWPPRDSWLPLAANALMMQIGGNVLFQVALSYGGLALTVPLTFGSILLSGAVLGSTWLGEIVTRRSWLALTLLMAAIAVLTLGSPEATSSVRGADDSSDPVTIWAVVVAVLAACVSGACFGSGGVVIRHFVMGRLALVQTLLILNSVSLVSTAVVSFSLNSPTALFALTPGTWMSMVAAGVLNGASFFAITRAFQLIPVVRVNGINASQVALCALAGVIVFQEAITGWLILGVLATVGGLLLLDNSSPEAAPAVAPVPPEGGPSAEIEHPVGSRSG